MPFWIKYTVLVTGVMGCLATTPVRAQTTSRPLAANIVKSWPSDLNTDSAAQLGFPGDVGFDDIIRQHIDENHG